MQEAQGYNSGTGVISVPGTTDHITEGTNLFYTDERVDDRVGALIVGGANITRLITMRLVHLQLMQITLVTLQVLLLEQV